MAISDRTALLPLREDDYDEEGGWNRSQFAPLPPSTPVFGCEPLRKQGLRHHLRLLAIRTKTSFSRGSVLRRHAFLIFSVLTLLVVSLAFVASL